MNLEKYNITWENRYKILPIKTRIKILSDLYEPLKERGEKEYLLKKQKHPRLLDENGNETNKLLILGDKRDGHQVFEGFDEKGYYIIFQAKKNELDKIEALAIIEDKKVKLSQLAKLQNDLVKPRITLLEFSQIKKEIDLLFEDVFEINNIKSKNRKKEFPKYCEVGSLFAQGLISLNKGYFYYKEKQFESAPKIAKFLKEDVLDINTDVRQYIDATLKKGDKNFYKSKTMMNNIIEYCKFNNIEITEGFQSKYNDLVNLH